MPYSSTVPSALVPARSHRDRSPGRQHETPIIEEEDEVDSLVVLIHGRPATLQERLRVRPLEVEQCRLHRRDPQSRAANLLIRLRRELKQYRAALKLEFRAQQPRSKRIKRRVGQK